jgi:hypothetical protein
MMLAGTGPASGDEVAVGDSRDDAIAALGRPTGTAMSGDQEFLFYERGKVTIQEGKVIESTVISESTLARRQAQQAEMETARRRQAEQKASGRISEGKKLKKRVLADEEFAAKPAAEQVQFWRRFNRQYPELAVTAELREAEARAREEDLADRKEELAAAVDESAPSTMSRRARKKWLRGQGRRNEQLAGELGLPAPDRPSDDLGNTQPAALNTGELGFAPAQETRVKDLGFTPPAERALDNLGFAPPPERPEQDLGFRRPNQ